MTATEMLTAGLNAALRRPIVNGAELRAKLIKQGVLKPEVEWSFSPATRKLMPNG